MGSGVKNYFRHYAAARKDSKVVNLVSNHGKEAYFHYFALLEMCTEKALAEDLNGDEEFVFHKRTVCAELMVTPQRLGGHLLAIQSSLLGHLVVDADRVKIKFVNLPKYLGRYQKKKASDSPKESKEKESKEKESKVNISSNTEPSTSDVREAYKKSYYMRYGIYPVWSVKENSLAKKLVASIGLDEAKQLAGYYPNYKDRFHEQKKHPFALLVSQVDQVRVASNGRVALPDYGNPYTRQLREMDRLEKLNEVKNV